MLKALGCCVIILACTFLGIERANEVSNHRKELEELYKVFSLFQLELRFIKTPVKESFGKLLNKVDSRYRTWIDEISHIENFTEDWSVVIDKHFKNTYLTSEEKDELKQIGKNIGCIEAISLYLAKLEISIKNTREEEKEKKKLYQSIGVMGGIFLVILLL